MLHHFVICCLIEADYIANFTSVAWGSINFYAPFSVNPPCRSISIANDNISCEKMADGSEACTAMKIGETGGSFDIASTYGRYYFHTKASYNTSSTCAGKLASGWFGLGIIPPTEPMRLFPYDKWFRGTVGYGDAGYVINDGWGGNGPATWSWMTSTQNGGAGGGGVWTGSNIPQLYDVPIPTASIKCPITIVPPIGAPSTPTVTSTSCTVGTSLTLAFTSTDPNDHKLRFGVDWDDDGTVDQFVPPTGYVPSGSEQSAKRTFAIPGEKHVAVMVENDRGARSEWTHYSFNCAEAPAEDNDTNDNDTNDNDNIPTVQQCAIGFEYQGGACVFVSCPIGYVKILQQCVFATAPWATRSKTPPASGAVVLPTSPRKTASASWRRPAPRCRTAAATTYSTAAPTR